MNGASGWSLTPRDPVVQRWATAHSDAECSSLLDQDPQRLGALFARQYMWVHQRWSPVGDPELLNTVASSEIDAIDPTASTCAWHDGEIVAVVFAFPTATESALEVVAETVDEHQRSGIGLLAAALACTIRAAAHRHCLLEFDGHITDPHLHPVLSELPWLCSDPLDLVEIN